MKVRACKICNICNKTVATHVFGPFYRTEAFHVTLPSNSIAFEDLTIREDIHLCTDCWFRVKEAVWRKLK